MRKVEIGYLVTTVLLTITHFYFAFAIFIGWDTVKVMESGFSWILFVYPAVNIFWFVVRYYRYIDELHKGFALMSIFTFLLASFPLINNFVHLFTGVIGLRVIPKQNKHVKYLNMLYQKKQEELLTVNRWGLDNDGTPELATNDGDLLSFLERDIQEYGDEYTGYLEAKNEDDEGEELPEDSQVVVSNLAYDTQAKEREQYQWLIPLYGNQVLEQMSIEELMLLEQDEEYLDEDDDYYSQDDIIEYNNPVSNETEYEEEIDDETEYDETEYVGTEYVGTEYEEEIDVSEYDVSEYDVSLYEEPVDKGLILDDSVYGSNSIGDLTLDELLSGFNGGTGNEDYGVGIDDDDDDDVYLDELM